MKILPAIALLFLSLLPTRADSLTLTGPVVVIDQKHGNTVSVPPFRHHGRLTGVEVTHHFSGTIQAASAHALVDFVFAWPHGASTSTRTETTPVAVGQLIVLDLVFSQQAPIKLGHRGIFGFQTLSPDIVTGSYYASVTYTYNPR